MFAAVREKLVGAWHRLRKGSLVRLFLFEFVVVLLGVLAAQWLAEWSNERQAIRAMEETRARLDDDISASVPSLEIWDKAIPCLDTRMNEVLLASAELRPLPASSLRRPRFFGTLDTRLAPETLQLIGRVHGDDVAQYYGRIAAKAVAMSEFSDGIGAEWQQLALINADYGQPSPADFHAARIAAGHIKSRLVSMQIALENFRYSVRQLGIEGSPNDLNRVAVPDCGTIWREGAIHVDANTGRGEVEPFKEAR